MFAFNFETIFCSKIKQFCLQESVYENFLSVHLEKILRVNTYSIHENHKKIRQKHSAILCNCGRAETAKIGAITEVGLLDYALEVIYSNLLYVL